MESRTEMLNQLYRILPEINDSSLRSVGESLIAKLKSMSDDDFAECGLVEIYAR